MKAFFYMAPGGDAWRNLAVDETFLNRVQPGRSSCTCMSTTTPSLSAKIKMPGKSAASPGWRRTVCSLCAG